MHGSGITVSSGLAEDFKTANAGSDVDLFSIRIGEGETNFVTQNQGKFEGDMEAALAAGSKGLEAKSPEYVLVRDQNDDSKRWILFAYVPDYAHVRQKTLYSSSLSALTKGLGSNSIILQIHISEPKELSMESIKIERHEFDEDELLTYTEKMKKEAEKESQKSIGKSGPSRIAPATSGLPVKLDDNLVGLLEEGSKSDNWTAVLVVNAKTEEFEVSVDPESNPGDEADMVENVLPSSEPRYVLVHYKIKGGENNEEKDGSGHWVFVFYCPQKTVVKTKVVYSSASQSIFAAIEAAANIKFTKQLHATEPKETSAEAIEYEVAPTVVQKKKRVTKARMVRRGRKTTTPVKKGNF